MRDPRGKHRAQAKGWAQERPTAKSNTREIIEDVRGQVDTVLSNMQIRIDSGPQVGGNERVASGCGGDNLLALLVGISIPFPALSPEPSTHLSLMEQGSRTKKTVFVGGVSDDVDESVIYENFSTFGVFQRLS